MAFGACFHDRRLIDGEFHRLFVAPLVTSGAAPDGWAAGQWRLLDAWDWRVVDELADVHRATSAPALLLWGEDDSYFPLEAAREIAGPLAGETDVVVLAKTRVLPHEERPDEYAEHVAAFLRRCFARPGPLLFRTHAEA